MIGPLYEKVGKDQYELAGFCRECGFCGEREGEEGYYCVMSECPFLPDYREPGDEEEDEDRE